MAELRDLPTDIYNLFDPNVDNTPSEENLDVLCENLKALLRVRLGKQSTGPRNPLRFSNLGKPDRQLWYAARESGEAISGKTSLKFAYGDVIEQLLLFLAKEAGHSVEREQEEIEVDGVLGHIDAIIDGVTVDVKSASPQSYAKFERGTLFEDDPFGYVGQISGYASTLTPDTGGAFLAFDKVHGDICVLNVGPSITNGYGVEARIEHLKGVIESDDIPERCYEDVPDGKSGNRKLSTPCSYCAFKNECWPSLRTFLYAGKPRFLTDVQRVPDVPELRKS